MSAASLEERLAARKRDNSAPPLDWEDLALYDPPARDWAIADWLGMGHATLLAGLGGIGKTLIAQTCGTALALRRDYLGEISEPRRVLMWACEDDRDELWRRQLAIAEYFGVYLPALKDFHVVPRVGLENLLFARTMGSLAWTPLWGELEQQVNDLQADVLILDNVGQTCSEENDRHAVSRFVNAFSGLRKGLATLLLAHPAKAAGSEYSGSTAWENAVRSRWYLGAKLPDQEQDDDPDDSVRYLCRRKANYSSKDYLKFVYRDGVLIPDALDGMPRFDASARADLAEAVILKCIPKLTDMGHFPAQAPTTGEYLPKLITKFRLNEGLPKSELETAMRNLLLRGVIAKAPLGKYSNRATRYGLVVT